MPTMRIGPLLENTVGAPKLVHPHTAGRRAPKSALESAEFLGRWWFDPASTQLGLSNHAAHCLQVAAGSHQRLVDGLNAVVLDDLLPVVSHVLGGPNPSTCVDFRVMGSVGGLRWLRMCTLPRDPRHPHVVSGTVADITPHPLTLVRSD